MTIAQSAGDVLRNHVLLEAERIDRMYLNVYVPPLQSVGCVVGYLRVQKGQRFCSTSFVAPMTEAFVRSIDVFADREGVDLLAFHNGERKDDVTQEYLRAFRRTEAYFGPCVTSNAQLRRDHIEALAFVLADLVHRRAAAPGRTYLPAQSFRARRANARAGSRRLALRFFLRGLVSRRAFFVLRRLICRAETPLTF